MKKNLAYVIMTKITGIDLTSAEGCSFWNDLTLATSEEKKPIMNGLYTEYDCEQKIEDVANKKRSFKDKMKKFGFSDAIIEQYLPELKLRTDKDILQSISTTPQIFNTIDNPRQTELLMYIGLGNSETDEKIRGFGNVLKEELTTLLHTMDSSYKIENFDHLYEKVKSHLKKNNKVEAELDIIKMLQFYVFSLRNPYIKLENRKQSTSYIKPEKSTDVDEFQEKIKSDGYTGELTIDTELDTILKKDESVNEVTQELQSASEEKQKLEKYVVVITEKRFKDLKKADKEETEKIKAESAAKINNLNKLISEGENFVTELKKKLNIVRIEVYTRLLEESITELDLEGFFKKIQDEMSVILSSPEKSGGRKRNIRTMSLERSHGFRQRPILHKSRKTKRRQNKRRRTQKR
jgi:hypothetical protein